MNARICKFLLAALAAPILFLQGCAPASAPGSAAFVSAAGLCLYDFGAGEQTLLFEGENLYNPVFSPDGKYIYFKNSSDVFVYSMDGGRAVLAAPDAEIAGFFNGKMIAITSSEGVLYYDPASGESETAAPQPEDGSYSYFLPSPDGMRTVRTVTKSDAGRLRPLRLELTLGSMTGESFLPVQINGRPNAIPAPVAWSPDGSSILIREGIDTESRHSLHRIQVIDEVISPLGGKGLSVPAAAEFSISPDGAFAMIPAYKGTDYSQLYLALIDLSRMSYSLLPAGYTADGGSALSRGGRLAAISSPGAPDGDGAAEHIIFAYSAENQKILKIAGKEGVSFVCPLFSGDYGTIAFIGVDGDGGTLYLSPSNNARPEAVFSGILPPDGLLCSDYYGRYAVFGSLTPR